MAASYPSVTRYLPENPLLLPQNGRKLVITAGDPISVQILLGVDMKTLLGEENNMITQLVMCLEEGVYGVRAICDNTDLCLCY